MSIIVTLTPAEYRWAATVGLHRHLDALGRGYHDPRATSADHRYDHWSGHIEGACAEAAVCKALDVQWTASNNTLKRVADIPPDIEVRSRSGGGPKGDCLIIRPNDPDDRIHILVLGHCPRYELVGAMRAGEAKQEQWWSDYNGRGAAFFLPPTALYPVHLANARARILLYSPAVAGFCVP